MRTTLDLPRELLEEAMKVSHAKTKTKVIITALEELIRRSRLAELKKFKGKVDLDMDLDAIRGRKCR
ncbi:MAG: type II toxin-antitoxin system VapB family antitoxin [Desulfobulbaceae bacterium]